MNRKNKNQLYVSTREEWRTWLQKNHKKYSEIWLIFYKKHTSTPTLEYDASVEEALGFGWIDSIIKKLDDERYIRKFTPRKSDSNWSEINKKRAEEMITQGKMMPPGMKKIQEAKASGKWSASSRPVIPNKMPEEFEKNLEKNPRAQNFFHQLAPSYKKQFLGWISTAKRKETQEKRIKEAIDLLKQGKKLGLK